MSGKKLSIVLSGILVFAIVGTTIGVSVYQTSASEENDVVYKETTVEKGNLTVGVTESGSISIGTQSQSLEDLDSLSTSSSSASTTTSTSSAGETAVATASASQGTTSSSSSVSLEVESVSITVGQQVAIGDGILTLTQESVSTYRETLEEAVETAELALKTANLTAKSSQLTAEYTYNANIANGNVAQSEYDATVAALQAAVDSAAASVNASAAKITTYQEKIADGEDYSAALAEEQANYHSLLSKLTSAQNAQTTKTIEAEEQYTEAMLNYTNASNLYSIDVDGIDDTVSDATDDLEDANEALQEFDALVGDGTIYSQYTGTVSTVGYVQGDTLSSSTDVATFEDAAEITMTVSVSQEDITDVEINDTVEVELTAYEDVIYSGIVESMDTSTSSGTSTVSYDVTVLLTGEDLAGVYQDMTGNVTFISDQVTDVLYVSNKAIINEGTAYYVHVKNEDGSVQKTEVTTGFSDGVNVEITNGLEEGQIVLIESQVATE